MSSCSKWPMRSASFAFLALSLVSSLVSGCSTSSASRPANPRPSADDRLNAMVGRVTRADVVQEIGPPNQTMTVDGDDFFIYTVPVRDRTQDVANALSAFGAGAQGMPYSPAPRPQQTYILRFDGKTGLLKGWNMR